MVDRTLLNPREAKNVQRHFANLHPAPDDDPGEAPPPVDTDDAISAYLCGMMGMGI